MKDGVDILDVVALTEDLAERGLHRGQVRTVVVLCSTPVTLALHLSFPLSRG